MRAKAPLHRPRDLPRLQLWGAASVAGSACVNGNGSQPRDGLAAGGAIHHLNTPDESMILGSSKLPMRFTGHAGANIKLGRNKFSNSTSIMPNVIYQYQNGFQELNVGTYIKYENFTAGVWYRNRDAFILCLGISTPKFKVGADSTGLDVNEISDNSYDMFFLDEIFLESDNFIKDVNPSPKACLRNFRVDTEMSTTSDEKEWDERKQQDQVNFLKLFVHG